MTATQLALTLDGRDRTDPDAEARETVRWEITQAATVAGGVVSPNAVRVRLAGSNVPSHIVGQVYAALRREGRLVPYATERSDDKRGGNGGRLIETYRWVSVP
jgi:hypothetical protein